MFSASIMKRTMAGATILVCLCAAALYAAAGAPPPVLARDGGVLRATLPNGLRVVIVRNNLAPVVATAVNYLVGSEEAPAGFPGTAHAQEHMMFRGTPGLSADQLADIGAIMGGNFNANTRESLTQYLYTVPAEDVDIALHIEALRMAGVDDSEEGWAKERGAIEQEVAADVSNPFYRLYAQLRAKLFADSVYEQDALGTKASFDGTTAAALKKFHDTWYAPNNAILVIVGDVDPNVTLAKVRALFGAIPSKTLPPKPAIRLRPVAAAHITLTTDKPSATQLLVFRLPGLDNPDYPALEILSDVLSSQRADLYGLVAKGQALETEFAFDPMPSAGMGYAAVSFRADGDSAAIDLAIREILAHVHAHGISADLVSAAKLQEHRQAEFQKNSIAGLASAWSDAIALYGLPSPEADVARLDRVSVEDVNRVARKYLDLKTATSATLIPQSSTGATPSSATFGGQETIALGEATGGALPDWANKLLNALRAPGSTLHPSVSTLPNGLTIIVQPTGVSDTVTIVGHIRNRPEVEEPKGKEGVSLVLDQMLSFGTQTHDRLSFQQALDEIGAQENAGTDFSIKILRRYFERGTELLAENELHPALPEDALVKLKSQLVPYVASRNHSPSYLTQHALLTGLYPADDPLLRQSEAATVQGLSHDDVASYYTRVYRPDLTTIVVIGNVTSDAAKAMIAHYFGGWRAEGSPPQVDPLPVAPNRAAALTVPDRSRIQDNVTLAQTLALPRSNPDFYALQLGNAVLGGGFYATRLSIDLRKNAGLVYSVNSDLQPGRTRSAFLVRYASDPQNVAKAAAAVAKEVADMQKTEISLAELQKAKALLLRQIPLNESGVDKIAREFLRNQDLGLPIEESRIAAAHYLSLTPAEVQAAFQRWMRPDDFVRASQGPAP
jgi:zinc protease